MKFKNLRWQSLEGKGGILKKITPHITLWKENFIQNVYSKDETP